MTFFTVVEQVLALLQRQQRISYRALKREFDLDDAYVEDLKTELIQARRLARDEGGVVLVWSGDGTESDTGEARLAASVEGRESKQMAAERRQLTVMFCDLVGSTALSAQLDPEELRDVVRTYQHVSAEVISRFEGHIAQYLGDGLLIYFGYPLAHEDDAQRAVRAGLGLVEAMRDLPRRLRVQLPHPVQVRIGIHTGLVVVGEMGSGGRSEQLALGETPNLAARLQGLAAPDTVLMSGATFRLSQGFFACRALGPQTVKGLSTTMEVYQVLEESGLQSRFEVAAGTGLTPLVGRQEELSVLRRRWAQAQERAGQVVLLQGEPGIGKSRLVQALKEQASADGAIRIEFHCSPYHQNSALYPIITHLQQLLQFQRDDSPHAKLAKLDQALAAYRFPQADTLPVLAALLSLPHPAHCPALTLSPQKQRQKTQEVLVTWIIEETERAPVYCAWEDLHWADPSTLDVLTLWLDQVPATRLLGLLTARPEFLLPWQPRPHLTPLTLSRLAHTQAEELVAQVTGGKVLPADVVRQIVAKTDGVPLFVEELTKMVLESGWLRETDGGYELTGPLPPLAIPATLHDSLMARLDRLATGRDVVQLGATIGREFSYELLQAVAPIEEAILQHELAQLVKAELLYQQGHPPQVTYLFKHALVQEEAYESLLKSRRQQYHARIAQVLTERFVEVVEAQPETVAHHYTEAALQEQAVAYWQRAGQHAIARSAHAEAINHLTKGIAMVQMLPETSEHIQHEIQLQTLLSVALLATKGYAAPEVERTYVRARGLCQQIGDTPQLFPVLWGLWAFYYIRGEFHTPTPTLAAQCLQLATHTQDPTLLLQAHFATGNTLLWPEHYP